MIHKISVTERESHTEYASFCIVQQCGHFVIQNQTVRLLSFSFFHYIAACMFWCIAVTLALEINYVLENFYILMELLVIKNKIFNEFSLIWKYIDLAPSNFVIGKRVWNKCEKLNRFFVSFRLFPSFFFTLADMIPTLIRYALLNGNRSVHVYVYVRILLSHFT